MNEPIMATRKNSAALRRRDAQLDQVFEKGHALLVGPAGFAVRRRRAAELGRAGRPRGRDLVSAVRHGRSRQILDPP
jgi:hypothetical protein